MTALYGNDKDFWTSDNDESLDDTDEEDTIDTLVTGIDDLTLSKDTVPHTQLIEYEDPTATDDFVKGPSDIPNFCVTAPKNNMIRKTWVIYDDLPVDNFNEDIPTMALKYSFELDPFQKRAIRHVHNREHTFVAAHTSAGKTVVAEYAIAAAAARGRRAIYTSPIKTLSNQKFRDFKNKFDNVGIITGDVSINPQGQCLIVTTEILRAMLYRGDAILNQLDVVIFDEVHYVNDVDRGVVWEEVIIMLSRDVCLVMLSATVPNYKEFADWIGRTKQREVFAIATRKRPTPLKHFLWANDKEFLIMDQSRFRVEAFNELYKYRRELTKSQSVPQNNKQKHPASSSSSLNKSNLRQYAGKSTSGKTGGGKIKTDSQRLQFLIKRLEDTSQLPVVIFCFSRRRCESFPSAMSKLDLLQQDERSKVHVFLKDNFSNLSDIDQKLPQVVLITDFLKRGIGIHHGGLLPIVKEAVEILFARGFVKVLFATETFSMGVNMPARSVVFSSVEKHDGQRNRTLLASEYTQMAGRAGRRGLDAFGSVYILCQSDEPPDQKMLLQLATQRTLRIEDMMALSFREHSRARRVPTLKRDQARISKQLSVLPPIECIFGDPTAIETYGQFEYRSRHLANQCHWTLWKHQYNLADVTINHSNQFETQKNTSPPFCPGRIAMFHSLSISCSSSIGIILGLESDSSNDCPSFRILVLSHTIEQEAFEHTLQRQKQIDTLITCLKNPYGFNTQSSQTHHLKILKHGQLRQSIHDHYDIGAAFHYYVLSSVSLQSVGLITSCVLNITKEDLEHCFSTNNDAALRVAATYLDRLNISIKGQWVPMTLSKQLRSVEIKFLETLLAQKDIISTMNQHMCHTCSLKEKHFQMFEYHQNCNEVKKDIENLLRVESLHLYDEMKLKYELLKQRQFVDAYGSITLKGQLASALTTNDDITLTEALLANILHNKTPEEVAALLSCFIFPDKTQDVPLGPTHGIVQGRAQIESIHTEIEQQMKLLRIPVVHEDWWKLCNFGFSLIAFQWAEGQSFKDIMEGTDIQEGTIVRAILRLDELIRKVKIVARSLLDDDILETLMDKTSQAIRRDVIFAMSLYLK